MRNAILIRNPGTYLLFLSTMNSMLSDSDGNSESNTQDTILSRPGKFKSTVEDVVDCRL